MCLCGYALYVLVLWVPEETLAIPEAEVIEGCGLPDMGAVNQAQFLWKNSIHSLTPGLTFQPPSLIKS